MISIIYLSERVINKVKGIARQRCLSASIFILLAWSVTSPFVAEHVKAEEFIKVGVFQNKPIVFYEDGAKGLFVDVLDYIAEKEGWKIKYVLCELKDCFDLLRSNQLDLMTSYGISPERLGFLEFSKESIWVFWGTVYVHDHRISSILDLENKRIGVRRKNNITSSLKKLAIEFEISPQYVEFDNYESAFKAFKNGELDAIAVNNTYGFDKRNELTAYKTNIVFNPFAAYFAAPKKGRHAEKLTIIDQYVKKLKTSPDSPFQSFRDRWFRESQEYWTGRRVGILSAIFLSFIIMIMAFWRYRSIIAINKDLLNNITVRKQTEEALKISEERLKETAMIAKVGGWETDLLGNTLSWTEETFRIHEIENNIFPDVDKAIQYYHPDDRHIVSNAVQNAIEKGNTFDFETRMITEKRNLKWVRAIGHIVLQQGKPVGLRGMIQDITDRKKTEEKLIKNQYYLTKAQEIGNIGTWELDIQKNILTWTEQNYKIFGVPSGKELTYEVFLNCVHPDDREYVNEKWRAALEKEPYDIEHRLIVNDGVKWVREKADIEFDAEDNPVMAIGFTQDITNFKQAEKQIKSSLKEKETLLQEIHHRVKNNMQVVNSLLKLQADNIADEKVKDILKDSQSRVYAMAAVHETLHGSEKLSEIELSSYLHKVTTSIFNTFSTRSSSVKLTNEIDPSPISINQAYPLGLIINELISNALKYAFPDDRAGELSVSMKKLDEEFLLTVMDDGVGFPEEFDWKNTNSLGLKLVRNLVENQLNGSIELSNSGSTRFMIKFKLDS